MGAEDAEVGLAFVEAEETVSEVAVALRAGEGTAFADLTFCKSVAGYVFAEDVADCGSVPAGVVETMNQLLFGEGPIFHQNTTILPPAYNQ